MTLPGGERKQRVLDAKPAFVRLSEALWAVLVETLVWLVLVPATTLGFRRGVPLGKELAERLGRAPLPEPPGRRPWLVHAVSAGEMIAASALVAEMARRGLGLRAVLATSTSAGRRMAEGIWRRFPDLVVGVTYLPWDRPRAITRWLSGIGCEAVVVIEAELWPGLFRAARAVGVPLAICSGRLTGPEARRYRLIRPLFRHVLSAASWVGVQTPEDLDRFVAAGAHRERVEIAGNLKWDAPPVGRELPVRWRDSIRGDYFVGGSTHEPEERILLGALHTLRRRRPAVRLVLAPRRVARAPRICRLARQAGFLSALLSAEPPSVWDVLVVDDYGFLPTLYAAASAAFVGGSLAPRGGHSPLEPALLGVPILMGPFDASARAVSGRLETAGALRRVDVRDPAGSVAAALEELLGNAEAARTASRAARAMAEAERGAAALAADRILALVGGAETGG